MSPCATFPSLGLLFKLLFPLIFLCFLLPRTFSFCFLSPFSCFYIRNYRGEFVFSLLSQKTEGRENVITLYTISFKCLASIALSISQNFFFSPKFIEFKLSKINKVKEMIQRKRKKSLTSEGDCALESPFKTFFCGRFPLSLAYCTPLFLSIVFAFIHVLSTHQVNNYYWHSINRDPGFYTSRTSSVSGVTRGEAP